MTWGSTGTLAIPSLISLFVGIAFRGANPRAATALVILGTFFLLAYLLLVL